MKKPRLVLVGNGMAGIRTLEELLKIAPGLYDITVFGAEPHPNYNRILLSPVLAGEQTLEQIVLNPLSWYAEHGITLHLGCTVTELDRIGRRVGATGPDGRRIGADYDRLLLATGSTPFIPPIPGRELAGVLAYRDIADTQAMIDAAGRYRHAVVIGGGLLGLEAANGLMRRGMQVTVLHLMPWLMERQLDGPAAQLLQRSLEARGLRVETGVHTEALLPAASADDAVGGANGASGANGVEGANGAGLAAPARVGAVRLKDGRELPADLVVVAAGIRPNTALAESAGLHCARGIVAHDTLQTITDPRIYAVGECVAHRGVAYGLVAPLFEQGKVCATHLAQLGIGRYTGSRTSTQLKVTGIDVFSAGEFGGGPAEQGYEEIVLSDPIGGVYKKLVVKDDKLVGACLYGDTADGGWYFRLLREGRSIQAMRDRLVFGEQHASAGDDRPDGGALALQDGEEVCGCNGVTKGTICRAIRDKGLTTLDAVRRHTKASASCGSCTGLVEQLLVAAVGEQAVAKTGPKAVCGCTDAGHAEVRRAIREQELLTMPDVMRTLGWRTSDGCATCRPALNYYLISTWPKRARDDPQSRFINERSHANIQKDGTYSVVPRMWGGETSAAELRRIADAVDKYRIPTVKVTGGQRIDLLGVKKEDLAGVWRDIGMPSGHAYAKALRTVKTCVGSEWCRFGTQDSTAMGKALERALWRMAAPHKVKLAVSGCPRNCAEAGIKDVGVIGVDSGWEIHVAGNGGIRTEVAQLLVKVKTADEVLAVSGAFLQLYREEGWYLERTVHFVARVGLAYVKQRVVDDLEGRNALWQRLQFALDGEPDPWFAAEAAQVDLRQFTPLTMDAEPAGAEVPR
jgi:nitrite reductase (NADH) large subunit